MFFFINLLVKAPFPVPDINESFISMKLVDIFFEN